jgi:hypothetical protein
MEGMATSTNTSETQRQVRLLLRDDEDQSGNPRHRNRHNLFVRLSSEVAWDLQNLILSSNSTSTNLNEENDEEDLESCWVLLDEHETSSSPSVDFLPLQITLFNSDDGTTHTIYASFNGGTIQCDDNIGALESRCFGFFLSWSMIIQFICVTESLQSC